MNVEWECVYCAESVKLYVAQLTFTQLHFLGTVSSLKKLIGTFNYFLLCNPKI